MSQHDDADARWAEGMLGIIVEKDGEITCGDCKREVNVSNVDNTIQALALLKAHKDEFHESGVEDAV